MTPQKLRCSDCGDLSDFGTQHDCWVRVKLREKPLLPTTTCPVCLEPTYGLQHWRCADRQS